MPKSFSKRWTDMFGIFSLGRGVHDPSPQECSWERSQSRSQLFFWILYNPYSLIIGNEIGKTGNVPEKIFHIHHCLVLGNAIYSYSLNNPSHSQERSGTFPKNNRLTGNVPGNIPKIIPNSSSGYCIILILQSSRVK